MPKKFPKKKRPELCQLVEGDDVQDLIEVVHAKGIKDGVELCIQYLTEQGLPDAARKLVALIAHGKSETDLAGGGPHHP